jgi:decaprenylphospho-beta-D-ribofuranose 2-oxidase
MSATDDSLCDIQSSVKELDCYSGLYSARARVVVPEDANELPCIFDYAKRNGYRVTLRAGGHSFDGQALGNGIVISLSKLDTIEVFAQKRRVRVGPGATWGAIVAALKPHGLVPAVTVTTEHATAGGTLSGDCLSRFSPAYGKEGTWIVSFELLTVGGRVMTCERPRDGVPQSQWTLEERAFCGVIGGLGYLGAVVSITYCVLAAGSPGDKIGVRTVVRKFHTFANLGRYLVPNTTEAYEQKPDPADPKKLDAIFSALDTSADGSQSALYFTSAFTTNAKGRRMPLHRPKLALRVVVEWVMRRPKLSKLLWHVYFLYLYRDGQEFVDDLEGFTFFMDGNARAKRIAKRFGFAMRNVQQTFIVPSERHREKGWRPAEDQLVRWLEYAHAFLRDRGLTPTLHDVLFLPQDLPFRLSASADGPGFAVSYAFETSNEDTLARAQQAFIEMADHLWNRFGGRVYLVKNVFARPATLQAMYGNHVREFVDLKRQLDPDGILRNDFLERTFGNLLPPGSAPSQGGSPTPGDASGA